MMNKIKRKCWMCFYTTISLISAMLILLVLPMFNRELMFNGAGSIRFAVFGIIALYCLYETFSFRKAINEVQHLLQEFFFVLFLLSAQQSGFGFAGIVYSDKSLWGFLFLSTAPVGVMFLVSGFRFIREIKRNL